MRSPRIEGPAGRAPAGRARHAAFLCGLALAGPAGAAEAARADPPPVASASAVAAAAAAVRQDPLLIRVEKRRELQWRNPSPERSRADEPNSLFKWLAEAVDWLSESGRVLLWVAGIVLAAVLVVRLRLWRWLQRGPAESAAEAPPTHVRELDIRPGSLPEDVGAAAWQRWQGGDVHGALVLLYRGMLSRLVHRHGVPLRASSTEGECLALAGGRLPPSTLAWLQGLVGLWRGWVYGGQHPPPDEVRRLCGEFAAVLPAAAVPEPAP